MGPNRCVYNLVVIVFTVNLEYKRQQKHVTAHLYNYMLQQLLLYRWRAGGVRVRGRMGEYNTIYDFRWDRDGMIFYDVDNFLQLATI